MVYGLNGVGYKDGSIIELSELELGCELDESDYVEENCSFVPSGCYCDYEEVACVYYDYDSMKNDAMEYFESILGDYVEDWDDLEVEELDCRIDF